MPLLSRRTMCRFWIFCLKVFNAFAYSMAILDIALPLARLLLAWTNLEIMGWNPNHFFPAPDFPWAWWQLRWVLKYLLWVFISGSILRRIKSHEKADKAWRRSRAMAIDRERVADFKVEACDTYIREAKEGHHTWCSEMLDDFRRQQRELRIAQESFQKEKAIFGAQVAGATRKRAQSV